jgi:hypothetical protein
MKKQIILYMLCVFAVVANAQPIPKSVYKTPIPKPAKTTRKIVVIQKPVYIEKNNDRDGDGLIDAIDDCPDFKGSPKNNGCPESSNSKTSGEEKLQQTISTSSVPGDNKWAEEHGLSQIVSTEMKKEFETITKNKEAVPTVKYEFVDTNEKGLIRVKLNGKWGFVNNEKNLVIPLIYDMAWRFQEGLAAVKLNGKLGFINERNETVIPFNYETTLGLEYYFTNELAAVVLHGNYGFISLKNEVVIPFKYDNVQPFSEDLAAVMIEKKYGFVNRLGKLIIPFKYDDATVFKEGLAPVKLNGYWGFINPKGQEVIPFKYVLVYNFYDGKALVKDKSNNLFWIDKNDNRVKL